MNISFFMTQKQIRAQTKTVTRRLGWKWLPKALMEDDAEIVLQPVVKGQGIPKGAKVRRIGGPIKVVSARRELLSIIAQNEVDREGFPEMTPREFVKMFCEHNGCFPGRFITRIEFEYLKPLCLECSAPALRGGYYCAACIDGME